MKPQIRWIVDFGPLIGDKVRIVTRDGFKRTGTLNGITFIDMKVCGIEIGLPTLVQFDDGFELPFEQIESIEPFSG
jgi:hypothetical protein